MILEPTEIRAVVHIAPEPHIDSRGFFVRTFCQQELASVAPAFVPVQINLSHSNKKGTLRGLHFQKEPYGEDKIVQCLSGSIYDVAVDLRPDSETYLQSVGCTLTEEKQDMVYIPKGFAHGFITLSDSCLIQYFMSAPYMPSHSTGVRFDDPLLKVQWPISPVEISDQDMSWALLTAQS